MGFFDDPADGMFLAGILLLTLIGLRKWYSRNGKRARRRRERVAAEKPLPAKTTSQPLLDAPSDVLRWQVEMHELSRDLSGQLDSKMAALQTLIAHARDEADRLESLLEEARELAAQQRGA